MSHSNPNQPPFAKGSERAKALGSVGGSVAKANRLAKASADPLTKGLLGDLLTYTTTDWMDRLDLTGPSWSAWRVVGKVLDGLPLTPEELAIYTALTGRSTVPTDLRELWALAGRGSGKTIFAATQAVKAGCRGYASVRGVPRVLLLAFVKEQAGISFDYCAEFFDRDKELRKLIVGRTRTELTLAHGVRIQTMSSGYRQVRGYSVCAALMDESAMWWNDATNANPDVEILRALRPALVKCRGADYSPAQVRGRKKA